MLQNEDQAGENQDAVTIRKASPRQRRAGRREKFTTVTAADKGGPACPVRTVPGSSAPGRYRDDAGSPRPGGNQTCKEIRHVQALPGPGTRRRSPLRGATRSAAAKARRPSSPRPGPEHSTVNRSYPALARKAAREEAPQPRPETHRHLLRSPNAITCGIRRWATSNTFGVAGQPGDHRRQKYPFIF